ncbi:MAG: 2OG-Fe(II) oxygenase [Vicinamibacterales bacterium]
MDWAKAERDLWDRGAHLAPGLLTPEECQAVSACYDDAPRFRSHIDMARYRFGQGEYKYFARPLPPLVDACRMALYARLAPIANGWMEALDDETRYPAAHSEFVARCAAHGQSKPTPLLLKYGPGDYNCLHQDLYGEVAFPLQVAIFLSEPGVDYTGGEFLLVEQRPRAQSAGEVLVPGKGDAVIFTTRIRPVRGAKGFYRAQVRHGVSRVRSGCRFTLGVIFHDAL